MKTAKYIIIIISMILVSCDKQIANDYEVVSDNCSLVESKGIQQSKVLEKEKNYIVCGIHKTNNYWDLYRYFIFDEERNTVYSEEVNRQPKINVDELISIVNISGTNAYQTKYVDIDNHKISETYSNAFAYNKSWVATMDYSTKEIIVYKLFSESHLNFFVDIDVEYSMGHPIVGEIYGNILHIKYRDINGVDKIENYLLD